MFWIESRVHFLARLHVFTFPFLFPGIHTTQCEPISNYNTSHSPAPYFLQFERFETLIKSWGNFTFLTFPTKSSSSVSTASRLQPLLLSLASMLLCPTSVLPITRPENSQPSSQRGSPVLLCYYVHPSTLADLSFSFDPVAAYSLTLASTSSSAIELRLLVIHQSVNF